MSCTDYDAAALDWMLRNTKLDFDPGDPTSVDNLPAGAKLFIEKYGEIMSLRPGIASESLGGASQSFNGNASSLLWQYARDLIGAENLKAGGIRFFSAKRRWR